MKRVTFYGHEKNETTAKLAQINAAVHGMQGTIRAGNEAITYYKDPNELTGKCDFAMANPRFNGDEVDADKIRGDKCYRAGAQRLCQNVGGRDRVLNGEIDADAADGRQGVSGVADAQQAPADTVAAAGPPRSLDIIPAFQLVHTPAFADSRQLWCVSTLTCVNSRPLCGSRRPQACWASERSVADAKTAGVTAGMQK